MWIAKRLAGYAFAAERNCLHEITKQVKDVVKLRGLDAGEPYVVLEGRRVELPTDTFLANLAIFKKNAYCAVHDVHYNTFYPGTPVIRVLSGSFFSSETRQRSANAAVIVSSRRRSVSSADQ